MDQASSPTISGVYTGVVKWNHHLEEGHAQRTSEELQWMLTLSGEGEFPSAIGASSDGDVLCGSWESDSEMLTLRSFKDCNMLLFKAKRQRNESDLICLAGLCFVMDGNTNSHTAEGSFYIVLDCAEYREQALPIGYWQGSAVPDSSLEAFAIPVNPIMWSMCVNQERVYGAGFFNDAADVPGNPVILFHLEGEVRDDGIIVITKKYIDVEGQVLYEGRLQRVADRLVLTGTWANPDAQSFGSFSARLAPFGSSVAQTLSTDCTECKLPIEPGSTAWECPQCIPLWRICDTCYQMKGGAQSHDHAVQSEEVLSSEVVVGECCADIIRKGLLQFRSRHFIGEWNHSRKAVDWLTYGYICEQVFDACVGLEESKIGSGSRVLVMGDLHPSYIVSLLAVVLRGCVVAPVHGALSVLDLQAVLDRIQPAAIIIDHSYFQKYADLLKFPTFVMYPNGCPDHLLVQNTKSFDGLVSIGRASRGSSIPMVSVVSKDHISAILFTSGSSGPPKGAMYSEKLMMPSGGKMNVQSAIKLDIQKFHPSYIVSLLSFVAVGGKRVICTELDHLLEAMSIVRPSFLSAPPVFFNMLHREYLIRAKSVGEASAAREVRAMLGNRMVSLATGGSPIAPQVLDFVREVLSLKMADLYGAREAGPIACNGQVYSSVHVQVIDTECDEVAVLEDDGAVGEVVVHSKSLIDGYYEDESKTNAAFINIRGERYYRTGDVGQLHEVDGVQRLKLLGRVRYSKMASSQWLDSSRIEAVLEDAPWIHQALVCSSLKHPFAVALVSMREGIKSATDLALLVPLIKSDGITLHQAVAQSVAFWCHHHHVQHFPQRVLVVDDEWTTDNGLLTPTFKKARAKLQRKYLTEIDALFDHPSIADESESKVSSALHSILSSVFPDLSQAQYSSSMTVAQLGLDSIATTQVIAQLRQMGVNIDMRTISLYPIHHIDLLLAGASSDTICIDPMAPQIDWASELSLPSELRSISKGRKTEQHKHVFLTGCTGFLGPFLLRDILRQQPDDVFVYCLMRDNSIDRIVQGLQRVVPHEEITVYTSRIKVVSGDLSHPKLGLEEEVWDELVHTIGVIYHNGALVNIVLPYQCVRAANVNATVEVIKLALLSGAFLAYSSTVAVMRDSNQEEDYLSMQSEAELNSMGGYASSKVVAECLLAKACTSLGLQAAIFRISAISGDTDSGLCNAVDFTTLLCCAAIQALVRPNQASMKFRWIPVNFVSAAIPAITRKAMVRELPGPFVYHLLGKGVAFDQVMDEAARSVPLERVGEEEWREAIMNLPPNTVGLALREKFAFLRFDNESGRMATTVRAQHACEKAGVKWREVDQPIVGLYMRTFKQLSGL